MRVTTQLANRRVLVLAELFVVTAPVLFGAGVDYVWVHPEHAYPTEFVSHIVFNIGPPYPILTTSVHTRMDLHSFSRMALVSALICVYMTALDWTTACLGRQE